MCPSEISIRDYFSRCCFIFVAIHPDDLESTTTETLVHLLQMFEIGDARLTPSSPEVEQDVLTGKFRKRPLFSGKICKGNVRQFRTNGELDRFVGSRRAGLEDDFTFNQV